MDLSSGTSGMLLGIGLASLGVGVALKILKSVESEIVLKPGRSRLWNAVVDKNQSVFLSLF